MYGTRISKLLASALLGSVALSGLISGATAADVLEEAVVDEQPAFALTGTGGVIAFNLPAFDTGFFGHEGGGFVLGGMIGGSAAASFPTDGDFNIILGLSGFGAFGAGHSSVTDTFTGQGTLLITGTTTPDAGSITLDANGADISSAVAGANGAVVAAIALGTGGAAVNLAAVTPDAPGFIMAGVTADASGNSLAYGGIGDDSGGVFLATGDLEGLEVTTSITSQILYGGADLTVGIGGRPTDTTSLELYVGPSYRGLFQTNTTDVTVNIAEELPIPPPGLFEHPEFTISVADELKSHYLGGVVGGNLSIIADTGVIYTLGVQGGIYGVHASWNGGQDTYSTCCGADGNGVASPDLSVDGPVGTAADFDPALAFAARANAGVTFVLDENKLLTLGGGVEYLSHVAQVDRSGLTTFTPGPDTAAWAAADPDPAAPVLSWGSMLNFTATMSLTATF
jgi:hypothetical protein